MSKLPKDGSIRRKRAFAWLPVKTYDGYHSWFEYYTRVERYCGYNNMWELQKIPWTKLEELKAEAYGAYRAACHAALADAWDAHCAELKKIHEENSDG